MFNMLRYEDKTVLKSNKLNGKSLKFGKLC